MRCIVHIALMRNPRQISVNLYWPKGMRCPRVFTLRQDMGRSVSQQVIASPVVHGWLMVWPKRLVVVVMLYESGSLRGVPHINPHHAFLQHVQVKARTLHVITEGSRKILARI